MPGFSNCCRFLTFWLLAFLFFSKEVFALEPIQERNLMGITAAEARNKLIATAESLLGTPYRHGGLDRRGLDCSGFVYLCFKEAFDVTIPRTSESIYLWTTKLNTAELQPGDLVFFAARGARISHVGIYAGEGRFIHSASEGPYTGVIFSRLSETYWRRTYSGAGRALPKISETEIPSTTSRFGETAASGSSIAKEPVRKGPGDYDKCDATNVTFMAGFCCYL